MILKNAKVLVIGAGISGIYASKLLLNKGAKVIIYDDKDKKNLTHFLNSDLENLVTTYFNKDFNWENDIKLVVISPGISKNHKLILTAKNNNCDVWSENDLAAQFINEQDKIIGITGTNGKSTTTSMIAHIFKKSGYNVFAGGNLGDPLSKHVIENIKIPTIIILELSSFQIEQTNLLKLDVAVFLNLSCNHLDRHLSIEEYFLAKAHILNLLKENRTLFAKYDLKNYFEKTNIKTNNITWFEQIDESYGKKAKLLGKHNWENAFVASLIANYFNISEQNIHKALKTFKPLAHRIEMIGQKRGLIFINDSKSTTVQATIKALELDYKRVHLLLGGVDKNENFNLLASSNFKNITAYYIFGKSKEKIANDLSKENIYILNNLTEALKTAINNSKPDDVILFSPACASYDQYNNFEERGEHFKQLVNQL